ncbi:MAG: hypothetical protein ACFB4I_13015 [Cyanophyceae cyanobacterium]
MSNQPKAISIRRTRRVAIAGSLSLILLAWSAKPAKAGIFGGLFGYFTNYIENFVNEVASYYIDYVDDFIDYVELGADVLMGKLEERLPSMIATTVLGDDKWIDPETYSPGALGLPSPIELTTQIKKDIYEGNAASLGLETTAGGRAEEEARRSERALSKEISDAVYLSQEAQEQHQINIEETQALVERTNEVSKASAGLSEKADAANSSQEVLKLLSQQIALDSRQNAELTSLVGSLKTQHLMATMVEQSQVAAVIQQSEYLAGLYRSEGLKKQISGANTIRAGKNLQGYATFVGGL